MDITFDEFEDNEFEGKSEEELNAEADDSESAKISLPEIILVVSIAALADTLEILAAMALGVPVVGQVFFGASYIFGLCVSGILALWALLKGTASSAYVKKMITVITGSTLDELTGGILPLRTITLIIAIMIHNRAEKVKQEKITGALSKGVKFLKKLV